MGIDHINPYSHSTTVLCDNFSPQLPSFSPAVTLSYIPPTVTVPSSHAVTSLQEQWVSQVLSTVRGKAPFSLTHSFAVVLRKVFLTVITRG